MKTRTYILILALIFSFMASVGIAADKKLTELTALTATATADILVMVDDPGGSPVTKKITVADFFGATSAVPVDVVVGEDIKQISAANHGGMLHKYYAATSAITAVATVTIETVAPANARIVGVQLHVKTALAGGETWDAAYSGGATQAIATAQAVAQNTDVDKWFDVNTDTDIGTALLDVTIERSSNPGVDTFTAQGEIEAVVYVWEFESWTNE